MGGSGTSYRAQRVENAPPSIQRPPEYRPFKLVAWYSEGPEPEPRLRVVFSTIDNDIAEGFNYADDPPFLLVPQVGTRVVLIRVTLDENGLVTDREIIQAAAKPDDTATVRYAILGSYTFNAEIGFVGDPINAGYGPVDVDVCFQDFVTESYNVQIVLK